MVSFEEVGLIISIISGTVIPIVFFIMMRHLKRSDSTEDKATMASFNVGTMGNEIREIKDTIQDTNNHFDKRLDSLTTAIEKRDERMREDMNKVWEKLENVVGDIRVHEYAIKELKRRSNNEGN